MTMLHESHPDDERLSAVADDDPETLVDTALAAHLAACERCTGMVAELRSLRVALAGLPDIAPPRPLRLVPPVERAPVRAGWLDLLRRLTAPAMGVAVVLILVGAVGSSASLLSSASSASGGTAGRLVGGDQEMAASSAGASAAASAPPAAPSMDDANRDYVVQPTPTASSAVPVSGGDKEKAYRLQQSTGNADGGLPYPWFLGTGVVLLAGVLLVRARAARTAAPPAS